MYSLSLLVLIVSSVWAENAGNVTITINGQQKTKSVLTTTAANVKVSGSSITLSSGGRVYIGDSPSKSFSPTSFFEMDLFGRKLKVDMDLSQVGCNCNAALYMLAMPAYNSSQKPEPGSAGDYYCDANKVGGSYCQDMDISEANKYAMASTAHNCTYVPPHYYSSCDHTGCGANVLDSNAKYFGPGKMIDTNKPFTLSVSFVSNGRPPTLSNITNHFWQQNRTIQFNSCNPNYLQWMGKSLTGMVMTMSLWGTGDGGMSWLDGKSGCHGGCNLANSEVTFSNFQVEEL